MHMPPESRFLEASCTLAALYLGCVQDVFDGVAPGGERAVRVDDIGQEARAVLLADAHRLRELLVLFLSKRQVLGV